jgi:hypothetical protein
MTRTTPVRTIALTVGDTVRFGNVFDGFEYATVAAVEKIQGRPQSRNVHIRFNHGGIGVMLLGVGSTWDVMKETSNANI